MISTRLELMAVEMASKIATLAASEMTFASDEHDIGELML